MKKICIIMGMENENRQEYKPIITFAILIINVIVFFIETATGGSENVENVLRLGGAYTPFIIEGHQWYRILTSMFLHYGIAHIVNNSISLLAMGQYVEAYFGRVKFIIIYIISGIAGNLLTIATELYTGSYPVSAGASGAICGLLGAMVILAIDKRTRKFFPVPRMIVAVILVLLPGFGDSSINEMAHLGGFIAGFIVGLIMFALTSHEAQDSI
ncbi:MAG: rhomboid family intramembrane serine protease [Eubacterium sp.]|nr:rhomboid family intramembrane serine protease [Eubacterium sp.]